MSDAIASPPAPPAAPAGPPAPAATAPVSAPAALPAPLPKSLSSLPEHRHCEVCGRSMAMGGRVCGPECQKKFDEAVKARKRSVYIFVALFALILFLSLYGGKIFGR